MIILLIKTDSEQAEVLLAKDNQVTQDISWQAGRNLAESIDYKIKELLETEALLLSNLDGIGVYSGPGSYTGLRIGHSVANALAYALNIPVVGSAGVDWRERIFSRLNHGDNDQVVVPDYGSPARTTKPRK